METRMLPVSSLSANTYNPNVMTDDEFAELVAEVRHLGRLPKPVVVQSRGEGYLIVDGEHGWRAAKDVGLTDVPCEVIDVDDFEAMRQTFKRNLHGTHDPVRLGQMFQRMKASRRLSQRRLAKAVGISEGTIRNSVIYAEAADLRNRYARDQVTAVGADEGELSRLTVRQVRHFVGLPQSIANIWLNSGANLRALYEGVYPGAQTDRSVDALERGMPQAVDERYRALDETGLVAFLPAPRSPSGFVKAMKTLAGWKQWEDGYCRRGLTAEDLRPYTRHCFEEAWPVRATSLMDGALRVLIDTGSSPPSFRLTPEDFAEIVAEAAATGAAALEFPDRLSAVVREKTGHLPEDTVSARDSLLEAEIQDGAPDYIRRSPLDPIEKYALWKSTGSPYSDADDGDDGLEVSLDDAKRVLAQRTWIERNRRETLDEAVARHLNIHRREERLRRMTHLDLARTTAQQLGLYDEEDEADALSALTEKLAVLTREELSSVFHCTEHLEAKRGLITVHKRLRSREQSDNLESPAVL